MSKTDIFLGYEKPTKKVWTDISLDYIYMDATSQINAKKICHWSKVCHVTSLTVDFIGSTQIKTVYD